MIKYFLAFIFFLNSLVSISQQQKSIEASRIDNPPKIDGILDDAVWKSLSTAVDFNMYEPENDIPIPSGYETEVKMAYDNKATNLGT